jgi:hypothetical protein
MGARALSVSEFAGLAAPNPTDKTNGAAGQSTAPSVNTTFTTTQADELLIGAIGVEGKSSETFTPGSGYTTIGRAGTNSGNAANNITVNPEYRIVNATGVYTADGTLGNSRKWAAVIVTYKKALPTKLAITSVNGGTSPQAGIPFSVVVQAQEWGWPSTKRN